VPCTLPRLSRTGSRCGWSRSTPRPCRGCRRCTGRRRASESTRIRAATLHPLRHARLVGIEAVVGARGVVDAPACHPHLFGVGVGAIPRSGTPLPGRCPTHRVGDRTRLGRIQADRGGATAKPVFLWCFRWGTVPARYSPSSDRRGESRGPGCIAAPHHHRAARSHSASVGSRFQPIA